MNSELPSPQTRLAVLPPGADGWTASPRPGLFNRPLYADPAQGRYFGWIRFDTLATTGMHQHLGPASSYIVDGALTDYQGDVVAGQMGINLSPATHEAIAYRPTLFVARLEAPVLYMEGAEGGARALHTGARTGDVTNDRPEELPDLNITVADLPMVPTSFPGVGRRLVHDYRTTGFNRRCVQIQMLPDTVLPNFQTADRLDLFVLGGSFGMNGDLIANGSLVAIEPGQSIDLATRYGALFFAWSDAPVVPRDRSSFRDPFGF